MALAFLRTVIEAVFGNDIARANVATELAELEARLLDVERIRARLVRPPARRRSRAA